MDGMDLTCGHFVNPFTDIGFKIIFGQPASKELLITLLNELLAGEHHIENLIFWIRRITPTAWRMRVSSTTCTA